jgi:TonB family protein
MSFALDFVLKPTLILMCATVIVLLLQRASASMRHAVWILAMAGAVLLPVVALVIPPVELPIPLRASTTVTFLPVQDPSAAVAGEPGLKPSTTHLTDPAGLASSAGIQPAMVWLLGVAALFIRLFAGLAATRGIAKTATTMPDDSWRPLIGDLSAAFRIRRAVRLLFINRNISPITWGFRRHTILLPADAARWSEERRRLVLAHELAHVKRRDGLTQIFIQIVCCLHWFNPLVWYAARRLRIERERACDDRVLSLGPAATDYADHLIQIVRGLRTERTLSLAAISMAQPSQLETRLVSILDPRARRRALSTAATFLLGALTAVLTASVAAIGVAAEVLPPPVSIISTRLASPPAETPVAKPPATPQRTRIGAGTTPSTVVIAPRVLESKPPIYTPEALQSRIEGTVTLEAAVDRQGNIKIHRIVKGLGYGLDERAIGTVLDWKFAPALRNGVLVEAITQIDVDFKLPITLDLQIKLDQKGAVIISPIIVSRVEPVYSEEARQARYQGTVVLEATIHKDGTVSVGKVVRNLGLGLDENAIEAVNQWKFQPAMRNGEPVSVTVNVQVHFKLK